MDWKQPSGRVVIAGRSGFLGMNLARHLAGLGCEIVILSRSTASDPARARIARWDARTTGDWAAELEGAAAIVNLVGRTVDCIKTPDHCDEILRSRVEATRALGQALRSIDDPPGVWAQMSTAHIYGDPPTVRCDEDSAFGYGLAPTVGKAWEQAFDDAAPPGIRKVVLRTSFVLGRSAGALRTMSRLARWGLGGRAGSGRQGVSWLHEHDMNRLFERAIADPSMHGACIATAPNPVSNAEFMRAIRRTLRVPLGLPAPAPLVRLGAPLLLRTDPELALCGRYCVPKRLQAEGFEFRFPTIEPALRDLLR
ncbi:MAG: DUF1731 domain-containing protein [Phycisphaeraceae bacterium]|nr:DUF1731 domain-containing protein [Phycisphaeraceae bacterium]